MPGQIIWREKKEENEKISQFILCSGCAVPHQLYNTHTHSYTDHKNSGMKRACGKSARPRVTSGSLSPRADQVLNDHSSPNHPKNWTYVDVQTGEVRKWHLRKTHTKRWCLNYGQIPARDYLLFLVPLSRRPSCEHLCLLALYRRQSVRKWHGQHSKRRWLWSGPVSCDDIQNKEGLVPFVACRSS